MKIYRIFTILFVAALSLTGCGGSGGSSGGSTPINYPDPSTGGGYNISITSARGSHVGETAVLDVLTANPGENVYITAVLPEAGRQMDMSSTEAIFSTSTIYSDGESARFVMPQSDVSISIEFSTSPVDLFELASGEVVSMQFAPGGSFDSALTTSVGQGRTVEPFWIGETEVTYELWTTVRQWAMTRDISERYTFSAGAMGGTNFLGSGAGYPINDQHPVSTINWRDAIVFANAVTEYYNAINPASEDDLTLVYYTDSDYQTPLRNSADGQAFDGTAGTVDNPYILSGSTGNTDMGNSIATGFRLPTGAEWEFGARYNKDESYTPGDHVSGSDVAVDMVNFEPAREFAIFDTSTSCDVRGDRKPNSLGCYDMSGNVWELTDDVHISSTDVETRVMLGGNFFFPVVASQVSAVSGNPITDKRSDIGLRLVRSAD